MATVLFVNNRTGTQNAEVTEDFSVPVLFCFLTGKFKETYQRVFRKVKEWLPDFTNSEDSKLNRFVYED